jgi:hypothetical protein
VLADTPAYLWWSSGTNNSKTYGPRSEEFWDRLDDLFAVIDTTLSADGTARRSALLHQYRTRVLQRLSQTLQLATDGETAMAVRRARIIQDRYVPEAWEPHLGRQVRARSILLRRERPDLLAMLWSIDADTACEVTATRAGWQDGTVHLRLDAHWRTKSGSPLGLVRAADRLHRDLPAELRAALPDEVLDFTETLQDSRLELGLRDRQASVTWPVVLTQGAEWVDLPNGRVAPFLRAQAVLDPADVAFARPLERSVHDLVARLHWDGASRAGAVRYAGSPAPAILETGTAVLYATRKKTLALDASATLRNVLADGLASAGPVGGSARGSDLALPEVAVFAPLRVPAAGRLRDVHGGGELVVHGRLTALAGGARLELDAVGSIPSGVYDLALSLADGPFLGSRPVVVSGGSLGVQTRAEAEASRRPSPAVRLLRRTRRLLRRRVPQQGASLSERPGAPAA